MLKYFGGACLMVLVLGAFFLTLGCGSSQANILFGKSEYIVGKDIVKDELKEFYYTIDASTNPPSFQRYRFTNSNGKYCFYHETREGNVWPLTEKHITISGTKDLSKEQWEEFYSYIKDGQVTKRKENVTAGGSGPWLFLYWNGDKEVYQVYSFADLDRKQNFELFCRKLKN